MLNPIEYINDCNRICGKLIDNIYNTKSEIVEKLNRTKNLWERNFSISYDFLDENSIDNQYAFNNFKSSIRYDIRSASKRQKQFYYQISLPHFTDIQFLTACLQRYKKFIYLRIIDKENFLVPCYGIDLMWHTHQVHPVAYSNDMLRILGYVFEHDDSVNDRTPGSKLRSSDLITRDLWGKEFNENYFFNGGMFRGEPPDKDSFSNTSQNFDAIFERYGEFKAIELELKPIDRNYEAKNESQYRIVAKNNHGKIVLDQVIVPGNKYDSRTMNNNGLYICSLTDLDSLKLNYNLIFKENTSKKIINVFKIGHKHDTSKDSLINQVLTFADDKQNEIKQLNGFVSDGKENYEFSLKYTNQIKFNRKLDFILEKKDFYNVNMLDILPEYDMFDLENKNFQDKNGEGIRAIHLVKDDNRKISLYKAEILHIISIQWSSVKILSDNNRLVSSAHLIGSNQLPMLDQISSQSKMITLNTKFEKAMLVRNINGDFAILKGKWIGFNRGKPPRGQGNNPGHLMVDYFNIETKQLKRIQVDKNFRFTISDEYVYVTVDLTDGRVNIRFVNEDTHSEIKNLHVESIMSCVFAISVLHVLLQPKIRYTPTTQFQRMQTPIRNVPIKPAVFPRPTYGKSRPTTYIYTDNHIFLSSIGKIV